MMMSLEWNESLNVGHPVIDAQHREIFKRFNQLLDACNQGKASESLQGMFDFLDTYVAEHFTVEEALMKRFDYPDHSAHVAQHDEFRERLEELKNELAATGISPLVVIRTNKSLIYWLTHHIQEIDARLSTFLQGRI